jgi:carboxymethylenebutenolidase
MREETEQIAAADGLTDAIVFRPDGATPQPAVIHLTDIFGIRPEALQMARRQATRGYVVLVPNLFYRTARPPLFDFEPDFSDERTMKRFHELAGPLTPDAMERDASAYVDHLAAKPYVAAGPMGVVGYCFTGAMALRAAAARADRVGAAASFHGGGLYTDAPNSPHLALPRVKARLYFGHATNDRFMPPEAIEKLEGALDGWNGRYDSDMYDGAHGWTIPNSPVYDEREAQRAFANLMKLFERTLGD